MKRIESQRFLNYGQARGIDTESVAKAYGIGFTVWLIKALSRPKPRTITQDKKQTGTQYFPYPKSVSREMLKTLNARKQAKIANEYLDVLKNAGFRVHRWPENTIDEQTNKIVVVVRTEIRYID